MQDAYSKVTLTVIALALCAVTAKLYLPAANRIGPHIGAPTRADYIALSRSNLTDDQRIRSAKQLELDIPMTRVQGGNIDVEVLGDVSLRGPVSVHLDQVGPLPVQIVR